MAPCYYVQRAGSGRRTARAFLSWARRVAWTHTGARGRRKSAPPGPFAAQTEPLLGAEPSSSEGAVGGPGRPT